MPELQVAALNHRKAEAMMAKAVEKAMAQRKRDRLAPPGEPELPL